MENIAQVQDEFTTDIIELLETPQKELSYIEQNHFGDFLIEDTSENSESFRLWRNNDENISQGEATIQIKYCGTDNNYTWETIFTL